MELQGEYLIFYRELTRKLVLMIISYNFILMRADDCLKSLLI